MNMFYMDGRDRGDRKDRNPRIFGQELWAGLPDLACPLIRIEASADR